MEEPLVLVTHDAGVCTLMLNRPKALNSFTTAMHAELAAALEAAAGDPEVRCLVLTGSGRGFCAGQDLAEGIYNLPTLFALRDPSGGDELRAILGEALNDAERERARKLVVATDGVAQTIAAAQSFLSLAHESLADVSSEPLRQGFASLIELLLEDLPKY